MKPCPRPEDCPDCLDRFTCTVCESRCRCEIPDSARCEAHALNGCVKALDASLPLRARFWVWWADGWVRLSLRDGQSLTAHRAYAHEEGWSSETSTWTRHGARITEEHATDGRDCDGRMSTFNERWTTIDDLASVMPFDLEGDDQNPLVPYWNQGDRSQRDYTAESMGY